MEDDYVIGGGGRFVGVFDGHGGSKVSLYLRQNLWPHLQTLLSPVTTKTGDSATLIKTSETSEVLSISSPQQSPRDILTADAFATKLQAAFKKIDADVQAIRHWSYQGSTAVCVYLLPDPQGGDELKIVSGNVGDSRAVLSRGQIAVDLTNDHKVSVFFRGRLFINPSFHHVIPSLFLPNRPLTLLTMRVDFRSQMTLLKNRELNRLEVQSDGMA